LVNTALPGILQAGCRFVEIYFFSFTGYASILRDINAIKNMPFQEGGNIEIAVFTNSANNALCVLLPGASLYLRYSNIIF